MLDLGQAVRDRSLGATAGFRAASGATWAGSREARRRRPKPSVMEWVIGCLIYRGPPPPLVSCRGVIELTDIVYTSGPAVSARDPWHPIGGCVRRAQPFATNTPGSRDLSSPPSSKENAVRRPRGRLCRPGGGSSWLGSTSTSRRLSGSPSTWAAGGPRGISSSSATWTRRAMSSRSGAGSAWGRSSSRSAATVGWWASTVPRR